MTTPAELRATRAEAADERYATLYAEIEAAEREEYDTNFDAAFLAAHPFKPNGQRVHEKVIARMAGEDKTDF